jgi:hypothetical protein
MISQLASVFSSQGVVLPDTEQVAFPFRPGDLGSRPAAPSDFPARFEQASVRLELSARALKAAEEAAKGRGSAGRDGKGEDGAGAGTGADGVGGTGSTEKGADGRPITEAEKKQIEELKRRDREVRAHEQAHLAAAGGQAVGGAHYEFQAGPDGRRYAVGGHVNIRLTQETGNPRATLQKAMSARAAATAPADPSGADLSVAAAASQMAAQASRELAKEASGRSGPDGEGSSAGKAGARNPYAQSRPETGRALNLLA